MLLGNLYRLTDAKVFPSGEKTMRITPSAMLGGVLGSGSDRSLGSSRPVVGSQRWIILASGPAEARMRPFAEKAFGIKRILRVNPRPVTVEDVEGIFRAAF